MFESEGYNPDQIVKKLKDGNFLVSLDIISNKITYMQVGQALADQDHQRGSWTNEDPDWRSLAANLDKTTGDAVAVKKSQTGIGLGPQLPSPPASASKLSLPMVGIHVLFDDESELISFL